MPLNETYIKVCTGKHLSDTWYERRYFITIAFNCASEYTIRKVQENQEGLQLNGTHWLFVFADDNNL
jgi:hypothetical protein